MGQVVDTESAREFMREALSHISKAELESICAELEGKSAWFRTKLDAGALAQLSEEECFSLLRQIFATRRRAEALLKQPGAEALKRGLGDLLHGDDAVAVRFQTFLERWGSGQEALGRDLASEVLHFFDPERYWLWTRWMWDPESRTGALPLVTSDDYVLEGGNDGETYLQVGRAVAFVHQVGESAGLHDLNRKQFGTDVFLGCVYTVYVYTVLRMRMTQEFNKVIPGLPEFLRRLFGLHAQAGNRSGGS